MNSFVIKGAVREMDADVYRFDAHKTMYGGKLIAAGDGAYVFASENAEGRGLLARAVVVFADAIPRGAGVVRSTPRVTVHVRRLARAQRCLGRDDLKSFKDWDDGRPETELNFKLYRQATDKIVGISAATNAFLQSFFNDT